MIQAEIWQTPEQTLRIAAQQLGFEVDKMRYKHEFAFIQFDRDEITLLAKPLYQVNYLVRPTEFDKFEYIFTEEQLSELMYYLPKTKMYEVIRYKLQAIGNEMFGW